MNEKKTTYATRILWLKRVAGSWPKLAVALNAVATDAPRRSHGHWHGLAMRGVGRLTAGDIQKIEALEARYAAEAAQANSKALIKRNQTTYIRITPETKAALQAIKNGTWDDTVQHAVEWAKVGKILATRGWIKLQNAHSGVWFCTIALYEDRPGFEEAEARGPSTGENFTISAVRTEGMVRGYGVHHVLVTAWGNSPLEVVEHTWRLAFPERPLPYD